MKTINIPGLENYEISEDGQVYSKRKGRWLKPIKNNYGYIMYSLFDSVLNRRKFHMVSRLVCYTYIGNPPTEKHEVCHIDHNRQNNHYTNLQWLTKSENILRTHSENKRLYYWEEKTKPSPGIETRIKMSNAKMKRIAVYKWGKYVKTYKSVELLCKDLGFCRRTFNRVINDDGCKLSKRFKFKFIDDNNVLGVR